MTPVIDLNELSKDLAAEGVTSELLTYSETYTSLAVYFSSLVISVGPDGRVSSFDCDSEKSDILDQDLAAFAVIHRHVAPRDADTLTLRMNRDDLRRIDHALAMNLMNQTIHEYQEDIQVLRRKLWDQMPHPLKDSDVE